MERNTWDTIYLEAKSENENETDLDLVMVLFKTWLEKPGYQIL